MRGPTPGRRPALSPRGGVRLVQVATYVMPSSLEELDALAEDQGRSRAYVLGRILESYLARRRRTGQGP